MASIRVISSSLSSNIGFGRSKDSILALLLSGIRREVRGWAFAVFKYRRSAEALDGWSVMNAGLDGRRPPGLGWNTVAEYLELYDSPVPVTWPMSSATHRCG